MTNNRVLLIEDNGLESRVFCRRLSRMGLVADATATIKEARTALRETCYSAIILDLMMPEEPSGPLKMNAGENLLEELNAGLLGELNQRTPVVVFTAQRAGLDRPQFMLTHKPVEIYAKLEQGRTLEHVRKLVERPKSAAAIE